MLESRAITNGSNVKGETQLSEEIGVYLKTKNKQQQKKNRQFSRALAKLAGIPDQIHVIKDQVPQL